MLVGGKFRAAARIAHSIFELGRRAPEAPPEGVGFQQVAEGVFGMLFLELLGGLLRTVEIERIDFFKNAGGFGRQRKLGGPRRAGRKRQKKKSDHASTAKR